MSSKHKEPGTTYSKYILYYSASTWKSVAKNSLINWKIFWWIRFNHLRLESERIITYKHVCWNFFENFLFFFLPGVFAVYFKSYDLNCCQHKNSPCLPLYRKFTMVNWYSMTICFPSIAPSAVGKFQRSLNFLATFRQLCSGFGLFR